MPARDFHHDIVKSALQKEGWTITHDPYFVRVGRRKGFFDLGAEMLAAEKEKEKIAIEIKSFLGLSDLDQFEDALGQFLIYLIALEKTEPDRELYLAIPSSFYESFFDDPFFLEVVKRYNVKLLIFKVKDQTIQQWIK